MSENNYLSFATDLHSTVCVTSPLAGSVAPSCEREISSAFNSAECCDAFEDVNLQLGDSDCPELSSRSGGLANKLQDNGTTAYSQDGSNTSLNGGLLSDVATDNKINITDKRQKDMVRAHKDDGNKLVTSRSRKRRIVDKKDTATGDGTSPDSLGQQAGINSQLAQDGCLAAPPAKRPKVSRARARRTHSCEVCGLGFPSEKYLNMHQSLHVTSSDLQDQKSDDFQPPPPYFSGEPVMPPSNSSQLAETNCSYLSNSPDQSASTGDLVISKAAVDGDDLTMTSGRSWTCNICWKTFNQSSNYKNHQHTHSAERPYVCEVCHIGFKERYHLKKHELFKHTNELKETCRFCGKRFKVSS